MRIHDFFESQMLVHDAAMYGIDSEDSYQQVRSQAGDLERQQLPTAYLALGGWALVHERLDEALAAYATGLARCYAEGAGPLETFGLMSRLADLLDSHLVEGDGDDLREDWLAQVQSSPDTDDVSRTVFLAHEAGVCAWHGRHDLASKLLERLEAATRGRPVARRRSLAALLTGFAGCCSSREDRALLLGAVERLTPSMRAIG